MQLWLQFECHHGIKCNLKQSLTWNKCCLVGGWTLHTTYELIYVQVRVFIEALA